MINACMVIEMFDHLTQGHLHIAIIRALRVAGNDADGRCQFVIDPVSHLLQQEKLAWIRYPGLCDFYRNMLGLPARRVVARDLHA